MKLTENPKWHFLLCLFLITSAVAALYGCGLKYSGPRIVKGGVMFRIKAEDAKRVAIAGSFNQWDADKDILSGPDKNGEWSIVIPLTDGRYEYLFLIDGTRWLPDPDVSAAEDSFGGRNSVVSIKR